MIIGTFKTKIYSTRDKKKLAKGNFKEYEYGTISIRDPELKKYIGEMVKIKIEKI